MKHIIARRTSNNDINLIIINLYKMKIIPIRTSGKFNKSKILKKLNKNCKLIKLKNN